jgi:DNA-directed RNA polymerase specialized sigma24 family protein
VTACADRSLTADELLRQHGFNGDRLLGLARRAANDAQRRAPAGLGGKYEDLVSFLLLQALESTLSYDPNRRGPSYSFSSYLYDIMERRVPDWYRRKSEGFGDSRNGNDDRIVLAGDTIEDEAETADLGDPNDPADAEWRHWVATAAAVSVPMADWDHVNERVTIEWARCAAFLELTPQEYHRRALIVFTRLTRSQMDEAEAA